MSYVFPSDQSRADDDQLNEACERIEELMDQLASRQALEGEPVMWSLRFDNGPVNHFTTYSTLEKAEDYAALCNIGKDKINIKIIPLYTHPASAVPDSEYIRALQDACDIIQADANTEQNYGSLCRIGSVLARLKSVQEKDQ